MTRQIPIMHTFFFYCFSLAGTDFIMHALCFSARIASEAFTGKKLARVSI